MIGFIQAFLAFVLTLGILVTFHEFGHFWVARLCDVKILRFSVGFGRPLWKRYFGKDKSEFVIAALPLGGYVKMLDEREGVVMPGEKHRAFNSKPLGQRFAIVVAGPLFNFFFAVFAYWVMFVFGVSGLKPIIGEVADGSLAMQSGIQQDDTILRVDDRDTPTWTAVLNILVASVIDNQQVRISLAGTDGYTRETVLDMAEISVDDIAEGRLLSKLGLQPKRPVIPAVIGRVLEGGAAERAGLRTGDRILAVDGTSIQDWREWVDVIRASPGGELELDILREEEQVRMIITPASVTENGALIGRIGAFDSGVRPDGDSLVAIESYSVPRAFPKAVSRTLEMSLMTLRILGKMVIGEVSVTNLSGPISIAQHAGYSARLGIAAFFNFLAIVSVSLGVLNLLPIPLLDGGHLLYYAVEFVKRSPVSDAVMVIGQQVGLAILLGLMGLAFYSDILRLIG